MFKSKRSSQNSVTGVYDAGAISSEASVHSILRNSKGKKKKKKKKNVDRNVTWSSEFQTYEERCPQSFDDDYDDDDYSYNRDTFDEDDDDDDYVVEHSDYNKQKPSSGLSSMFAPIAIPAHFKMTSSLSEDDASLIETMDNYYDGGVSKAVSDDASIVSYERIHEVSRQHEIGRDHGHLGLVMPSLGGFLSVLGVNRAPDDATDVTSISASSSSVSGCSNFSDRSEVVEETKAKKSSRTNAATTTKSKEKAGIDNRAAAKEKKATDTRSVLMEKKSTDNRSTPTETKVQKKKAKSTAELNVAIQQLGTNSTESIDSAIVVINAQDLSAKPSNSDDVIEPLTSDEASKNGNQSAEAVKVEVESSKKKKKKSSMFGLKNKRKSTDKVEVDKNGSLVESTKTSFTATASDNKVESLVENAMAQPPIKSQSVQSSKMEAVPAVAAEIKQSFSASTDGSSVSSFGKEKNKKKKSLKNKLSFRRKKSTILSGRELAFAYAQQLLAPLEDIAEQHDEFKRESSDEVNVIFEEEQKELSTKWRESIAQEPAVNTTSTNVKTQEKGKNKSNLNRKKADASAAEKKMPVSLNWVEEPTATRVTKEVNKPKERKKTERQVTVQQPTIKKKEKEMAPLKKKEQSRSPKATTDVKRPQQKDTVDPSEIRRKESASVKKQETSPKRVKEPKQTVTLDLPQQNTRDNLYDMILSADSFDSVSTTEDILDELQQIEVAAYEMYQSMVMGIE